MANVSFTELQQQHPVSDLGFNPSPWYKQMRALVSQAFTPRSRAQQADNPGAYTMFGHSGEYPVTGVACAREAMGPLPYAATGGVSAQGHLESRWV